MEIPEEVRLQLVMIFPSNKNTKSHPRLQTKNEPRAEFPATFYYHIAAQFLWSIIMMEGCFAAYLV
jgi:hypothetical protein